MSDNVAEESIKENFEQDVANLLGKTYSTYIRAPYKHALGADGVFTGTFSDIYGNWLVYTVPKIEELQRKIGDISDIPPEIIIQEQVSAILFVVPKFTPNLVVKIRELIKNHNLIYSYQINAMGLSSLELALAEANLSSKFDEYYKVYPRNFALIGHNSDQYRYTIEAIDAVTEKLATSNTHGFTADVRDRLLGEIKAGRRLLEATTVRVAALAQTIAPALKYIAVTCASAVLQQVATEAYGHLIKLIFP